MTQPQPQQDDRLKVLDAYIAYRALVHSQDQEQIAAALALALYPVWAIQRFTELDVSTPLWLAAAVPKVKTAYLQSQRVAAVFAEDVRAASLPTELPLHIDYPSVEQPLNVPAERFNPLQTLAHALADTPGEIPPELQDLVHAPSMPAIPNTPSLQRISFDDFPAQDVSTSLVIQGNYGIKSNMPMQETEAMYNGLANSSGAGIRQAMNGGRNAIDNIVTRDPRILGYARVTDTNPCYFCALLASRGTVYGKASFVETDSKFKVNKDAPKLPKGYLNVAKVHDHCKCQLRPVYAKAEFFDADAADYRDQWDDLTSRWRHLSNKKQIEKWKEEYVPHDRSLDAPDIPEIQKSLQARASGLAEAGFTSATPQFQWAETRANQLAA